MGVDEWWLSCLLPRLVSFCFALALLLLLPGGRLAWIIVVVVVGMEWNGMEWVAVDVDVDHGDRKGSWVMGGYPYLAWIVVIGWMDGWMDGWMAALLCSTLLYSTQLMMGGGEVM